MGRDLEIGDGAADGESGRLPVVNSQPLVMLVVLDPLFTEPKGADSKLRVEPSVTGPSEVSNDVLTPGFHRWMSPKSCSTCQTFSTGALIWRVMVKPEDSRGYSGVTYAAVRPPSTRKSLPVTYDDSSEARKSAACAISAASPKRPIGR